MTQIPIWLPSMAEMTRFEESVLRGGEALPLMEAAGLGAYRRLQELVPEGPVVVLCGPGNNGGDGFVIARRFVEAGREATVVLAQGKRYSPLLVEQGNSFVQAGGIVAAYSDGDDEEVPFPHATLTPDTLKELVGGVALWVDALLGLGQRKAPGGSVGEVLKLIESVNPPQFRVSIDLPTGIDGDSGELFSPCFRATHTLAIQFVKRGMLQWPAREVTGKITSIPIGIPIAGECEYSLIDERIHKELKKREKNCHKGSLGHVLVIGGSRGMSGAPTLSAMAALRGGAGLVTKAHLPGPVFHAYPPELMYAVMPPGECFQRKMKIDILPHLERATAVVIGPGMGLHPETGGFIIEVLRELTERKIPNVVDADALTHVGNYLKEGAKFQLPHSVLTPHPGEAARLLGRTPKDVERDRYSSAKELVALCGAGVVVLKGAATIVRTRTRGAVNISGTPYLATAGSGDVLAGLIGALLAQKHTPSIAAMLGVYLHGSAGLWASRSTGGSIIASDIVTHIPGVFEPNARDYDSPFF